MLILLLASGLAGSFFYYVGLWTIKEGRLSKGFLNWSRCVATPALLLAVCATATTEYFYEDAPYLLTLGLWLLFILALEPAYLLTDEVDARQTKEGEA